MDHVALAELLGNYGEFVGAIAVVVTLAYLAVQIRQQNVQSRRASMHDIAVSFREALAQFGELEHAELFLRFTRDFDSLDASEKYFIMNRMMAILRVFEEAFLLYQEGGLDERYWLGYRHTIASYFSTPGIQSIWVIRQHQFHVDFQEFLRNLETSEYILD